MNGDLLEAYCALAKADYYITHSEKMGYNKAKINNLSMDVQDIQRKIYSLATGEVYEEGR